MWLVVGFSEVVFTCVVVGINVVVGSFSVVTCCVVVLGLVVVGRLVVTSVVGLDVE